jgi:membrane protease YdiL (CAAX protease family)
MLVITALAPVIFNVEQLQALVIFPIILILVHLTKLSFKELGLTSGTLKDYGTAIFYPLSIGVPIIILAYLTGNLGTIGYNAEVPGKVALLFFTTLILAVATEEGFFRGWLFGILEREKVNPQLIILLTAVAFSLWHAPLFFLDKGFASNMGMIPLYLGGGVIAGMIFGLLRYRSGSIIVSSFSHALWNTTTYTLFGVGSGIGLLGIQMTSVFDMERGTLGMIFSIIFLAVLWYFTFRGVESVEPDEKIEAQASK